MLIKVQSQLSGESDPYKWNTKNKTNPIARSIYLLQENMHAKCSSLKSGKYFLRYKQQETPSCAVDDFEDALPLLLPALSQPGRMAPVGFPLLWRTA